MKKDKRLVYLELTKEIEWNLCPVCRYNIFRGSVCCDGYQECHHPLEVITDMMDDSGLEPGGDCWGFRNKYPLSDIADLVGIILSHNLDSEKILFYGEKRIDKVEGVIGVKGK